VEANAIKIFSQTINAASLKYKDKKEQKREKEKR